MNRNASRALPGRRLRLLAAAMPLAALLVTACGPAQTGATSSGGPATQPASPPPSSTGECHSVTTCYTPQQLQVAYGIKPLLDRGINGRGETVVLPELAESQPNPPQVTDMRQDMAAFDSLFHLPTARMRVVTTLAGARSPWLAFGEEALDVEMVHALAPDATLVILLVPSTSLDNTKNAVSAAVDSLRLGSTEGGVISISAAAQIGGEHCVSRVQATSVNAALQTAASRHVTVVAASGDIGPVAEPCDVYAALAGTGTFTPVKEVNLLASDPLVLSDDGTTMIRNSGGTSASAPIWAAMIALADQYAGRHLGLVNPAIYQIARNPRYHQAFHDVTKGTTPCSSRPRRSLATRRYPAGIQSPAGAAPTRKCSSRCSLATRCLNIWTAVPRRPARPGAIDPQVVRDLTSSRRAGSPAPRA